MFITAYRDAVNNNWRNCIMTDQSDLSTLSDGDGAVGDWLYGQRGQSKLQGGK